MSNVWSPIVDCAEEHATMREDYNDETNGLMSATVTLRCAYADRHALVADIVGNRRPWPKKATGQIPLASTAGIVPDVTASTENAANRFIDYTYALVTINYSTKITDAFSESIEPYSEFLTLDHRLFRWSPYTGPYNIDLGTGSGTGSGDTATFVDYDPIREEEAPGFQRYGINYVRTDFNLTLAQMNPAIVNCIGATNADAVTWSQLSFTSPVETLVYIAPTITTKVDSSNVRKWDVTKKFHYDHQGVNRFFRGATGRYHRIYFQGTTQPILPFPLVTFAGNLV